MSCWGTKPILGEGPVPGCETFPVTIPLLDFFARISMSVVFPAPMLISYGAGKHRLKTRTTGSKDSHHLPWADTTGDIV